MIMIGDRKKTAAAILDMGKKAPVAEKAADALQAISGELIDAVHAKDESAVAAALRAAFSECQAQTEQVSED